jgi:hypothetical protein
MSLPWYAHGKAQKTQTGKDILQLSWLRFELCLLKLQYETLIIEVYVL